MRLKTAAMTPIPERVNPATELATSLPMESQRAASSASQSITGRPTGLTLMRSCTAGIRVSDTQR